MTTPTFKRWLAVLAVGTVVSLIATGCGSSSGGAGSGPANAAPSDHQLKLSFLQDPGQPPDPDVFYGSQGLILTTNIYEGLLSYAGGTATPTLEPALATSWTESTDHRTFTFQLRKNVTFHDGTPFTAAAI